MLLKTVLEANGVNRNTYNSLERRTGLPFMKRGLVEGKRGDRYTLTHAVALGAMLSFQHLGIDAKEASIVVDAVYDVLIDWVGPLALNEAVPALVPAELEIKPDQTWLTISRFEKGGLGWATGEEAADTFSLDPPIAKLSINVAALVKKLYPRAQSLLTAAED